MDDGYGEIHGTIDQYIEFSRSLIWRDIVSEINQWLQQIHAKLEQSEDTKELFRLQGNAEACRYFMQLPDNIRDALQAAAKARNMQEQLNNLEEE